MWVWNSGTWARRAKKESEDTARREQQTEDDDLGAANTVQDDAAQEGTFSMGGQAGTCLQMAAP